MKMITISVWNSVTGTSSVEEPIINFYKNILWADESLYKMNACVNKHNGVYWKSDNLHHVMELVDIFAGGLIGLYFFDGTAKKEKYLDIATCCYHTATGNNPL